MDLERAASSFVPRSLSAFAEKKRARDSRRKILALGPPDLVGQFVRRTEDLSRGRETRPR